MQQGADFITAHFLYMFRLSRAHHQECKILAWQPPVQVVMVAGATCKHNYLNRWLPCEYFIHLMMRVWRPKHVEKVCSNKICILWHHVGVLFNLNHMFIINFCLNMFRALLCPSSGEQRPFYCICCVVLVLLDVVGSGCGALRCRMRGLWSARILQRFKRDSAPWSSFHTDERLSTHKHNLHLLDKFQFFRKAKARGKMTHARARTL